ncbi:MAG: ABC transporter permease, partial [Chloracidobacterium sp.]|nr:ABC transporter permease [Chloracidobacterium sp.]
LFDVNDFLHEAAPRFTKKRRTFVILRAASWINLPGGTMRTLWQDLRYGARMLWKNPGFSAVAVITLALGVGANTAIFSVVNASLLRPLPYQDSDRLVVLSTNTNKDGALGNAGYTTFVDWRERSNSFERMVVIRSWGGVLTGQGEPEVVRGLRVSADYFKLLGVSPALGRDFRVEEDRPDKRFVVVISHALWQRRFNSDLQVIGKQLILNDQPFAIVGVMPPNFSDFLASNFYGAAEVWAPVGYDIAQPFACRSCERLKAVARLKPEITPAHAGAEMSAIMNVMSREHPTTYATPAINVARLQDQFTVVIRPALYLTRSSLSDANRCQMSAMKLLA